ncbi:MAG: Ppx/GppA family phosphatase [Rhizomicrobium sp.]|jgi:exopolyphosphatase/guanosine-5'-triphosphate,3'-diphosphate pyrophosphatase
MSVFEGEEPEKAHGRAARAAPVFAALDLGTNNCRLLMASQTRTGRLRIVDSFSRTVRLGEGLAQTGVLSDAAIARAIAALKVCAARLAHRKPARLRAIATEACRRARNADVLIARARDEAGIALEIVGTEEEAHLAALGCAPLLGKRHRGALVFDIGGGSTEIVWLKRRGSRTVNVFSASVPVGVVTLAENGRDQSYAKLRELVQPLFAGVRRRLARAGEFRVRANHLLGASGTVTTLAAIALGLARYDRNKVDAGWHRVRRLLEIGDEIAALDHAGRVAQSCIGEDRAELMVPGLAIFAAICAEWPCADLRVADRGLREGMLREMMAETDA